MRLVQRVLSRREKVQQLIGNLATLRGRGEIHDDEYDTLLAEYEHLRAEAEANVESVRDHLRAKEQSLHEGRRAVDEEIRTLALREKVGELTVAQGERARRKLEGQLTAADRKIMRVESALNAQSSADVGGYIDVDVRAYIEPSKGVLGDELDAPEIVGAAQESMKEWQGRAHEFVASARIRGKEILDREDVASARSTLGGVMERAKAQLDTAADRTAESINERLAKHGRTGISASALKVAVVVGLLIVFLFIVMRDPYPDSPRGVLEAVWETANEGHYDETEQYLSIMTLGWMDEALAMMPGKNQTSLLHEKWDQRTRERTVDYIEIVSEDVKETRASVKYVVHYEDGRTSAPRMETFVNEDGHWKIESRMGELF